MALEAGSPAAEEVATCGEGDTMLKLTNVGKRTFAADALRSKQHSGASPGSDADTEYASFGGVSHGSIEELAEFSASADAEPHRWGLASDMADSYSEDHSCAEVAPRMTFVGSKVPVICGYMHKKSPDCFRLKAWHRRYFAVANFNLFWWKNQRACALEVTGSDRATPAEIERCFLEGEINPRCTGRVDLASAEPKIVSIFSVETRFRMLPPAHGWPEGATTDKNHDAHRDYEFDVEGSEHSRSDWVDVIRRHIEFAQEERKRLFSDGSDVAGTNSEARSEYWQDETVDNEARRLAKVFLMRSQAASEI